MKMLLMMFMLTETVKVVIDLGKQNKYNNDNISIYSDNANNGLNKITLNVLSFFGIHDGICEDL